MKFRNILLDINLIQKNEEIKKIQMRRASESREIQYSNALLSSDTTNEIIGKLYSITSVQTHSYFNTNT